MTRPEMIAFLEQALADRTWHKRLSDENRAIADRLKAEYGARVRDEWNVARVSMLGVSSTCATGLGGAFHNWIAAARRKDAAS